MDGSTVTYCCARCGVESAERTCFVFLQSRPNAPLIVRCIQCVAARRQANVFNGALGAIFSLVSPLIFMSTSVWAPGHRVSLIAEIALACLMYPTAVIVHELAHAVTGWLVGLEVGGIVLGHGQPLWRFQVRGLQVRLNTWLLSGRVYLGCDRERWVRARVWLAILMGPLSNALLVWVAAIEWRAWTSVVGAPVVGAWIVVNALIVFFNLVPTRGIDCGGSPYRSDGLALLEIPRASESQLQSYRVSALLVRGYSRFELEDYAGAQIWLEKALLRVPDNVYAILALGACKMALEEYSVSLGLFESLQARDDLPVNVRAALGNNIGFTLMMMNRGELVDAEMSDRADRVTAAAIASFPCNLQYRNARALVLAATRRPEEALSLLDYVNYASGPPAQAALRELVRAFALRKSGREHEVEKAAALALRLFPGVRSDMQQLGITPPSATTQLRLLGKPVPAYITWLRRILASFKEEAHEVSDALSHPQPLDTGQLILLRMVGVILAMFGLGLAALLVMVIFPHLPADRPFNLASVFIIGLLFGVSVFCLSLAYRLVLNRPNRHGSLLSLWGWRAMSVGFVALTVYMAFFKFRASQVGAPGTGLLLLPLVVAVWCWMTGRSVQDPLA